MSETSQIDKGYAWARDPFDNLVPTFNGNVVNGVPLNGVDSRGFVGGFQAGANWQSGSVVGGLEIDLSGAGDRLRALAAGNLRGIGALGGDLVVSTTSTLSLAADAGDHEIGHPQIGYRRGSSTRKLVRRASVFTSTRPPWASTICCTM